MKKVILFLLICLTMTGCSNIKTKSLEEIINEKTSINANNNVYNIYHQGYKYYLPKTLKVKTINESNEIITSDKYNYYLYVDLVSLYNDAKMTFEEETGIYKYLPINYQDNTGYLKVKESNEDYLVEIMYNYAKIEVIVKEKDLNVTVNNIMTILTTIRYNKDIIANLTEDNLLNLKDESLNLFENNSKEDNFIEYKQDYDDYEPEIPDSDVIREAN